MSGDLGNLLTGELGEAEARFSHEDFAALYGRRIAGRVRRRRAVRAAGVGGGTMLTAGALVVGVTQVPWGTLGATPGVGATDCVTPSPSDGANLVTYTYGASNASEAELVVTDPATGGVMLRGILQADGTWRVTDADGNSVEATPGPDGGYVVNIDGTSVRMNLPDTGPSVAPSDQTPVETFTYTVGASDGSVSPSASDDCYTADPTPSGDATASADPNPSPDASLAAKPDDVVGDNPFECGFEFPTESYATDDLWIDDARWITAVEAQVAIQEIYGGDSSQASDVATPSGPVAVVTAHFASTVTGLGSAITFGTASPTVDDIDTRRAGVDLTLEASVGATFVGVTDGRVVATGTVLPGGPWTTPPVVLDFGRGSGRSPLYLLDREAALTSCDANPVDVASIDLVAVAGVIVKRTGETVVDPTYAWLPVQTP